MTVPIWNDKTCFLRWSICCGADGLAYLHAQVEMCEIDILVCPDPAGTWSVTLSSPLNITERDGISSAARAQLIAVGMVVEAIADLCGEPMSPAADDRQKSARAMLQELHFATKDGIENGARDRMLMPRLLSIRFLYGP